MPFKSEAQRRFMHAKHPEMAKRWEKKTKKNKLPEKVENEEIEEDFLRRLDGALSILEASSKDPQATTRPSFGANKGPTKGSIGKKYSSKKKKTVADDPIADG